MLGVDDATRDILGIPVDKLDRVEAFVRELCSDCVTPPLNVRIYTHSHDHETLVAEQGFVLDVLEALLEAMEERGMSQADLARALGVSRASVSRVLSSTNLTTRTIFRYARAIGVDVRFEVGPPRSLPTR